MLTRSDQHVQRPCKEGRKSSEQRKQTAAPKGACTLLKALQRRGFASRVLSVQTLSSLPLITEFFGNMHYGNTWVFLRLPFPTGLYHEQPGLGAQPEQPRWGICKLRKQRC